jgi:hypothetical protein
MIINKDFIILVLGLIVVSIIYVMATYGYVYLQMRGYSFKTIYIISILLGILLYSIKVPLFYYYDLDNALITYLLYSIITATTVIVYSRFFLKENIYTHTYFIMFAILALFILNDYLTDLKKKH